MQTAANTVGWNAIASLLRYAGARKKAVSRAVKARAKLRAEQQAAMETFAKKGEG